MKNRTCVMAFSPTSMTHSLLSAAHRSFHWRSDALVANLHYDVELPELEPSPGYSRRVYNDGSAWRGCEAELVEPVEAGTN